MPALYVFSSTSLQRGGIDFGKAAPQRAGGRFWGGKHEVKAEGPKRYRAEEYIRQKDRRAASPDQPAASGVKHIFLINPAAGRGKSQARLAALCRETAEERRLDYEILATEYPGHGAELVKKAVGQSGGRRVRIYACGGDGTLNEAARGAFGAWNAAVTHYPAGTGNDFIKAFGAQSRAFYRLPALVDGKEIAMDYIQADCGGAVNVLSVGADARVAAGVAKYKNLPLPPGQTPPYLLSAAEHIIRGLGEEYEVEIDGVRRDGAYTLIFLGNGGWYGGGFCPVPQACPRDGLLDVLLVGKVSRLTAARVVTAYKQGRYWEYPQYIAHILAKEVKIRLKGGGQMCVNLDGEIAYSNCLEARLLPGLRFVMADPIQDFANKPEIPGQDNRLEQAKRKGNGLWREIKGRFQQK